MKKSLTFIFFFVPIFWTVANNVQITSISTVVTATTTQVEFNLTWSNSWRTSAGTQNWDAVWIFIKYKDYGVWKHLDLTGSDNVLPAGYSVTVPSDKKGAFIYRSVNGSGNVSLVDLRLGVTPVAGNFNIQVFGIEMVYIPSGQFYAGDGTSVGSFNLNNAPIAVGTAISNNIKGNSAGDDSQLKVSGVGIDGDEGIDRNNDGILDNLNFPTGYNSFYSMKYEISRRGYCDFLNVLSYTQQAACTNPATAPNSAVGTQVLTSTSIEISTPGVNNTTPAVYSPDGDNDNIFNEATDGEWKAVELLQWKYLCAYLDWAALRPMTELEFEKICRGPNTSVPNEFAWGTSTVFSTPYTITSPSRNNEAASNASPTIGNAYYTATAGAETTLRNGIFTTSTSSRIRAGSGFYGVMEMSGNISEATVTIGNNAGRSYSGKLGNGALNSSGFADVDFWPGINGNANTSVENSVYGGTTGVTESSGAGSRGIGFLSANGLEMKVSDRYAATVSNTVKYGGRGVRQEPYVYQPILTTSYSVDMEFINPACYRLCNAASGDANIPTSYFMEIAGPMGNFHTYPFQAGCTDGCGAGINSHVIARMRQDQETGVRIFDGPPPTGKIKSSYVFIAGAPSPDVFGTICSADNALCSGGATVTISNWVLPTSRPPYMNPSDDGTMIKPVIALKGVTVGGVDRIRISWVYIPNVTIVGPNRDYTTTAPVSYFIDWTNPNVDPNFTAAPLGSIAIAATTNWLNFHDIPLSTLTGIPYKFRVRVGPLINNVWSDPSITCYDPINGIYDCP